MRLQACILLLLVGTACSFRFPQTDWEAWKQKYIKVYNGFLHEMVARAVWMRRWSLVQSHNSRTDVTFTLEMNERADLDQTRPHRSANSRPLQYVSEVKSNTLIPPPPSFDWRTRGVISSVKNQGQLGNPAAFAVAEEVESMHAIYKARLLELSVQEVMDCCSLNSGMLVPNVFQCISHHGGLCSEDSYRRTGKPGTCRNNSCEAAANDVKTTIFIPKGNETDMGYAVFGRPLVVYVNAGLESFQMYKAGVYSDKQCKSQLDHALQLVGYGLMNNIPYWILKNSWGPDWGMDGYILMERGVNMCGVADLAFYPE